MSNSVWEKCQAAWSEVFVQTQLPVAITILKSKTDLKNKEAGAIKTGSCKQPKKNYMGKEGFLVLHFTQAEIPSQVWHLNHV